MRYYIRKQSMRNVLDQIVKKKDKEILTIFKEVMVYRTETGRKPAEIMNRVDRMLFMPRIIIMAIFNLILAAVCLTILPGMHGIFAKPINGLLIMMLLYCFMAIEIARIFRTAKYASVYYPYVVVDELISRKIITLVPKKEFQVTAKKNQKAKVAE